MTTGLGREVLDTLVGTGKHEILVLGRGDSSNSGVLPGVIRIQTAFDNHTELVTLLDDVHTLLCFWSPAKDPGAEAQKRLVNAAIDAGVRRFAPSSWSTGSKLEECLDVYPFYASKLAMLDYLQEINKDKKVIEYTSFEVGMFMEFLAYPQQTTKHISPIPGIVLLNDKRIIALEGHLDDALTFTSVEDIAGVVAVAVEYQGEWPAVGGINGDRLSLRSIQRIAEKLYGTPFRVDILQQSDVEAGVVKLDDLPAIEHAAIPKEKRAQFAKLATRGLLLSAARGAWTVTDDWNKLLSNYKFTSVEDFVARLIKPADAN
ncbi:hypothetical protein VHEMI10272 [[Torrubiella] hemipterigena]|uniref:NmrA-like domain-containing protein n=1 Tax=[Torrubiella] hemipterigena TaxID=1531966 RepID=A0A0A1TID8_9HYPO|nr:hypothetical protein VHEMI10272 [[Torrubiella] hemipterigena]